MQPTIISISKHLILSFLLVIFSFQFKSYSQTTLIPDSNFEQALINLNIDTNGLNGNILNCDAMDVFNLSINNYNIDDLSGIEAFTNLKTLNCSNNNLNSLNISQNIHLEGIIANDNSLSSIDLTQNFKLKNIHLNSNSLNLIDVANNTILEELSISENNLTTLDVSSNSGLKFLGCYSNLLQSINLSNNAQLRWLYVDFNDLSDLNLSHNTNLRTLSCSSNNLSEINVHSNTLLSYLDCRNNNITDLQIGTNSDLKRLFVSENNLNEIDLTNAPNLLLFYARFNNLSALDISGNPLLRWIKCEGNNLSTVDFRNGNNSNIAEFVMTENTSLNCIFVDDAQATFLQNWIIDDTSAFVEDESECEALSIKEENVINFNMFPNPASDYVSVNISTQEAKMEIYAVNGQLVSNRILVYGTNNISLHGYSSGLYLVKITSDNTSETKKLLLK